MATIQTPIPTWKDDAKPSEIQTEVRKALSDLSQQISAQLNSLSSNPLGSFPTASSGSIFNSGSNANGSYIRFSDGTMIQSGSATIANGGTITFPLSFKVGTVPSVSPVPVYTGTSTGVWELGSGLPTATSFNMVNANAVTATYLWIAAGLWK
jgi:hypothetical protein